MPSRSEARRLVGQRAVRVDGGGMVETVLIPDGKRATLCVSSQVGCSLDCSFCSTGKQGFMRDLSAAEIIGQEPSMDKTGSAPSLECRQAEKDHQRLPGDYSSLPR